MSTMLGACAGERCRQNSTLPDRSELLTIGDSILAFNGSSCESVGDFIASARGTAVHSASENGARMEGGLFGITPIPDQYLPGEWDYVLVNGGINDLNGPCGCGECDPMLQRLIGTDAQSGLMPDLLNELAARGHQILLVGYYEIPTSAWFGYGECGAFLDTLHDRYRALAESRDDTTFVDFREVMSPQKTPELYYYDDVHPNAAGSEALANYVAGFMPPKTAP